MEQINKIPKAFRKKLITQICRLCEKQYRKGFQQGATFYNDSLFTISEVDNFRSHGTNNGYKLVINPTIWSKQCNPDNIKPTKKRAYPPTSRIIPECYMNDMEELIFFLKSIEFDKKGYNNAL